MLCTGYLPGGLRIDRHGLRLQQQEAHRAIDTVHACELYYQRVFEFVPLDVPLPELVVLTRHQTRQSTKQTFVAGLSETAAACYGGHARSSRYSAPW